MSDGPRTPLDLLDRLMTNEAELAPGVRLLEAYTMQGLLKLLWYGDRAAADVVVLLGGAMGGFSGPAGSLFLELGTHYAAQGRGVICCDYRRPDKLDLALLDGAATADWAMREGARRFVVVGHSFGGAVAVQLGTALTAHCVGVATLATQSAGCEQAAELEPTPLVLFHGDRDVILGPENSAMVQAMAGGGDLRIIAGADHGFHEGRDELRDQLIAWIDDRFSAESES
ncbi:MAG: alpha/beta hydrolase [Acidimicrobiales bacterium]